MGLHDLVFGISSEGDPAGGHLVQGHAHRIEVGGYRCLLTPDLFRGHVPEGPQPHAGPGLPLFAGHLGDAEIHDLHRTVFQEHDVARLYVTVDDAAGMHEIERRKHTDADGCGIGEPAVPLEPVFKGIPPNVFHYQEQVAIVLDIVEDIDNVGMGDLCLDFRLMDEPVPHSRVLREFGCEDLDGNFLLEFHMKPFEDDPHPALADLFGDPIWAYLFADHGAAATPPGT